MRDYIRKAVELADGWSMDGTAFGTPNDGLRVDDIKNITEQDLDALAAQLVRQLDELDFEIDVGRGEVYLYSTDSLVGLQCIEKVFGPDRTMNTLRAIIDSGVLESD